MTRDGGCPKHCLDVKPTSVILHNHMYAQWLTRKGDSDSLGRRVSRNIRERVLHDAVQSCFHRGCQPTRVQALCMNVHSDAVGLSIIGGIAAQSYRQAQIIENAWMESSGQAPQIIEDLHGDVTELVHLRFRLLERSRILDQPESYK